MPNPHFKTVDGEQPARRPENRLQKAAREKREAEAREAEYRNVQQMFGVTIAQNAPVVEAQISQLVDIVTAWNSDIQGFNRDNFDGDCMLIVSEVAEAVEADRTDSMSDKIPEFHGREEELADALIRILHMSGKYKIRLGAAFIAKLQMNLQRPYKHGKKY